MKLAVIIVSYNTKPYLWKCLETLSKSNFPVKDLSIFVVDNASTDDTQDICQEFSKKDDRVKYVTQSSNIGASANFAEVLRRASGEYFMWLGDDDWMDASYVSHCVPLLRADPDVALASGAPIYYRQGLKAYAGRLFDLPEKSWAIRVAHYYAMVADNGMFYGIMRTAQLQQVITPNIMGGDWHLIANIVSMGKTRMSSAVSIHRELGGATTSYRQITKSLGLPAIQAIFPMTTIAFGAWGNIIFAGTAYKKRGIPARIMLAGVVFLLVIAKPTFYYVGRAKRLLKLGILFIGNGANNK